MSSSNGLQHPPANQAAAAGQQSAKNGAPSGGGGGKVARSGYNAKAMEKIRNSLRPFEQQQQEQQRQMQLQRQLQQQQLQQQMHLDNEEVSYGSAFIAWAKKGRFI